MRTNQLVSKYLRAHTKLSKKMTVDYKREAINNVITELYCKDGEKYITKNKDLIERARFGKTQWQQLKEECNHKMGKRMKSLENEKLPPALRNSIMQIYSHYKEFLDIEDIDNNLNGVMDKIFGLLDEDDEAETVGGSALASGAESSDDD